MRKAVIGIIGHMQGKLYDIGKNLYGTLTPILYTQLDTPEDVRINNGVITFKTVPNATILSDGVEIGTTTSNKGE